MTSFYVPQNQSPEVFDVIREETEIDEIHGIYAHNEAPYVQFEFQGSKDCIQAKKALELEGISTYLGIS